MTVVFSTYQSIEVVSKVQKALLKKTMPNSTSSSATKPTGPPVLTLSGEDESAFTKVHDDRFLRVRAACT